MVTYKLVYRTQYLRESIKQVWKEPPAGLIRVHLGRIHRDRDRGLTIVPVVAICENAEGHRTRQTTKVYLTAKGPKNIRLRRVKIEDETPVEDS